MIIKQPSLAYKADGSTVPYEVGKGFNLGIGTWHIDVGFADAVTESIHVAWDNALVATSLNYQESNLPCFKSLSGPYTDSDAGADVTIYDDTAGNWITIDSSTAYIPGGTGFTVTNMTIAIAGGTANGTIYDVGNTGARRARMKIVVTTGGYFRCHTHGKEA